VKCARTACKNEKACCWHSQSWELYCVRCARRINEFNPGCVVMWVPDTRDGRDGKSLISSDGKFHLGRIQGRADDDCPKWIMRAFPDMRDLGDYHEVHYASEYIRNHFRPRF
jgi:hypothetical protein